MKISLIAAIGKNRELGKNNSLLFQIPEDMKFFREKTRGHAVIMGRKTYESIGRPLPNRTNIVVSRTSGSQPQTPDLMFVRSIEEAIEFGKTLRQAQGKLEDEIFVIGGAQIYELAMPYADKLYLTLVDAEVKDADAFFPDYKEFRKEVSKKESRDSNFSYTFLEFIK